MKFSEQWLRTFTNCDLSSEELCKQFTVVGLEVDSFTSMHGKCEGVVVGEVLDAVKHPNADKLSVCTVNVGTSSPLTIVCGAKNVRKGLKVPVALCDAILANDLKIKETVLRGVPSCGMICSASELGMQCDFPGILELPLDAEVGLDFGKYFVLDDNIIELNITPNRGDCLSILGLAREVFAFSKCSISLPDFSCAVKSTDDIKNIVVTAKQACPSYSGRIIRNIDIKKETPFWIVERLKKSDIRPLNLVVDITNYVMLELGQPLHAFDLKKISGDIEIRMAKQGEVIDLLNGQNVTLSSDDLVIADDNKLLALAGIMGGKDSEIDSDTVDIFLESAFFDLPTISKCSHKRMLHTDASHRFERGVDPRLQHKAIERATCLLQEIDGNCSCGKVVDVISDELLPKHKPIYLRKERIAGMLGMLLGDNIVIDILNRLNMQVHSTEGGWMVLPPSYRFDINIEMDLVEELARIYGYEKIPESAMSLGISNVNTDVSLNNRKRLRLSLVDNGYSEVVTYSFIEQNLQSLFCPEKKPIHLLNPISSDLAVMRTSLLPGLIKSVVYNINRKQERMKFFEIGLCFLSEELPEEKCNIRICQPLKLAGVSVGDVYEKQWGIQSRDADFFDVKNDIENFLYLFVTKDEVKLKLEPHNALHPSVSAGIYLNETLIGVVGRLHPKLQSHFKISEAVYLFEIDLSFLNKKIDLKFKNISKFPFVKRDIALIINEKTSWNELDLAIKNVGGELLQSVQLFDVYTGENIPNGHKSIALRLVFQHIMRTLNEAEIDSMLDKIILALQDAFSAKLRT